MEEAAAREERARRRRNWPVRVYRLGEEPPDQLAAGTTAVERWAMVLELTLTAWAFRGEPLPDYARSEMPVRRFEPGERRED